MKIVNRKIKYILHSLILCLILNITVAAQEDTFQKISRMVSQVSLNNIINHIQILETAGGHYSRVNFTPGNDSGKVYIENEFRKLKNLSSVEVDTFYISSAEPPNNTRPMFNVIATIEGTTSPNKVIVLGAHYDCSASREDDALWESEWETIKAPGADDNATGVAAILEIARVLSDSANNFNPNYTVKLIAFGAEESGPSYAGHHFGSLDYAARAKQRNENIIGMVSIDMIGYNDTFEYNSIVSNPNSKFFAEKFLELRDMLWINLHLGILNSKDAAYSDHASFWDEGYKAILFIENAPPWNNGEYYSSNPYYHTSGDSSGTLNFELVKRVAQLNLAAAAAFSSPLTTDAEDNQTLPGKYVLYQNYPNPFNPVTKIKYSIPHVESKHTSSLQQVSIIVYDILGKKIATLVNEEKSAGKYEVTFDAGSLPSGVYHYRLTAGNYTESKKMILLR